VVSFVVLIPPVLLKSSIESLLDFIPKISFNLSEFCIAAFLLLRYLARCAKRIEDKLPESLTLAVNDDDDDCKLDIDFISLSLFLFLFSFFFFFFF